MITLLAAKVGVRECGSCRAGDARESGKGPRSEIRAALSRFHVEKVLRNGLERLRRAGYGGERLGVTGGNWGSAARQRPCLGACRDTGE